MKACKYCGTKNKNSAEECRSCTATEFVYKCENCGTEFESAAYCPSCGVKAGRSARTCPECGEVYFTKACPECGYVPNAGERKTVVEHRYVHETAPKKKKVTFGTVLLWIFFLPIMGIIAIWKAPKLPQLWKIILTAAIVIFTVVYGIANSGKEKTEAKSASSSVSATAAPAPDKKSAPSAPPVSTANATLAPEPLPDDNSTLGERNALKKALSYLDFSAFSYNGLIKQLEFEDYSHEEAVYGANNCGADWNEQAAKKALSYLDYSAFSYKGLIEQLEFEEYTHEEAVYGVEKCGADWNEQAAKKAKQYLDYSSFSRKQLIEQLEFEGFTSEQAAYGAAQNGY